MPRSRPKPPDPAKVAREQARIQAEIVAEQKAKEEASLQEAQVKFASSEERKRQLKRKGRRTMIATPYGYLGDTTEFGTTGSLLT